MNIMLQVDVLIFSFVLLTFLLVYYSINAQKKSPAKKIFIFLIISLMVNSTLAALTYIPNGINEPWAISMNIWVNSLLLAFSFIPIAGWIAYVDHKLFNNFDNIKKRGVIYLVPFIIVVVMVATNSNTGIFFTIEEGNVYTKQYGIIIISILTYVIMFILFLVSQSLKQHINTKLLKIVFMFMLIPIVASMLQLLFAWLNILWPSFIFATFMVFLLMEKEDMLKDALTKLNSRIAIEARIKHKIRRQEPFSLIMIDLDEFKQINDIYGHKVGDSALMVVASILEDSVKRTDMVCRYGGDEFLILVESPRPSSAKYVVNRVSARVKSFNKKSVKPYSVAMSFGQKFFKDKNMHIKQIISDVDKLMYMDKGVNRQKRAELAEKNAQEKQEEKHVQTELDLT